MPDNDNGCSGPNGSNKATMVQPVVFGIMFGLIIFSGFVSRALKACIRTVRGDNLPQNAGA